MNVPYRWAVRALVAAAVVVGARGALALPRVAIVTAQTVTEEPTTELAEVEAHLEAELRASGFEVVLVRHADPASLDALEAAARDTQSVAAITIVRRPEQVAADVWITDRVTGKTLLRRVRAEGAEEQATRILALRAVELLHASLIELNVLREPRGDAPAEPALRAWVEPAPLPTPPASAAAPMKDDARRTKMRDDSAVSIAIGGGVLAGRGGVPAAAAPALTLSWRPLPVWSGQLFVVGPALSTVEAAEGSAELDQELALLRIGFDPTPTSALSLYAALGAGIYRMGARGRARDPYEGRSAHALAALFGGGAGARIRMSRQLAALLQADVLVVTPRPALRFANQGVAETGLPALLASLALELSW